MIDRAEAAPASSAVTTAPATPSPAPTSASPVVGMAIAVIGMTDASDWVAVRTKPRLAASLVFAGITVFGIVEVYHARPAHNSEYVRQNGAWLGGWIDFAIPGWTTHGGATPGVKYVNGIVMFRGVISNPSFNGGFTAVADIPAGIPLPSEMYSAGTVTMNSTNEIKARVTNTGKLEFWRNGAANPLVSLAGLSYAP